MIRVHQLGKRYMMYQRPLDRLADWLSPARWQRGRPFWALREISFELPTGASMGIVGVNGAGKSTLLKILTGTTLPTEGSFELEGRISSLLELGAGFHPEFTGRQNIQFNGKMAGLTDQELAAKFDSIAAFSELGAFLDQPVRTYSSGMALRLGFALASSVDPDVLIIDEALSVGDLHFQQKCLRRIREFHERGVTVLFVSHDPSLVKSFCTEAILLDEGRLLERGKPDEVLDYYTALLAEKYREGGRSTVILRPSETRDNGAEEQAAAEIHTGASPSADKTVLAWESPPLHPRGTRTGNFRAVITSVEARGGGAHGSAAIFTTGSNIVLRVRFVTLEALEQATVGIALKDRLGREVFGVNTAYRDRPIGPVAPLQAVEVGFRMELNIGPGLYSVVASVHTGEDHTHDCFDWVEQALAIQVIPNPLERFEGLVRLPLQLELRIGLAGAEELEFARRSTGWKQ